MFDASGKNINLMQSPLFLDHYNNTNNCAEFIIEEINTSRMYDEFFPFIQDGVVLDIGANVGLFSLYIQTLAKQIYCIEPTPAHVNVLRDLVRAFDIRNVNITQGAIFKTTGTIEFSITTNSTQNSFTTYGNSYDPKISVASYTLNDFLLLYGIQKVDFIKMDIEGSEKDVFEDAALKDALEKVNSLYVELHPVGIDTKKLIEFLSSVGYDVQQYMRDNHLHAIFANKIK